MKLVGKAHAKINPYLSVGRIRADGYHEVDTILQAIQLHDVISISPAEHTILMCSDRRLEGENNLVSKALRLASEIVELPPVEIHIEKNIPMEAGLGGGSSDVATALLLLNRLVGGALSPHIDHIGTACGSDVPFFLQGKVRARATGRGEKIEALPALESTTLVIAKPHDVHSPTAAAYKRLDQIGDRNAPRHLESYNDFERVAPCESLELIDRLTAMGCRPVGLCGSGSAVYGFTETSVRVESAIRAEGHWATPTNTITEFSEPWTQ